MHITWLISGSVEKRPDGSLSSATASVRYRVLYAAEYLSRRGHQVDIVQSGLPVESPELEAPLRADVVVVSKGLFDGSVAFARRAKHLGAHLLLDLCDDHFDTVYRDTCVSLCQLADQVTASTPTMANVISKRAGRKAIVIGDPYEAPPDEPTFQPSAERVRLLWFGHPTNFDTLATMMPALVEFSREQPIELHVVSENVANITSALADLTRQNRPCLETRFTPWSQESTWRAIAECDMVVIPSLPSENKLVKSPNRLVESLRCGRFVAAYPLPSYQPFAKCVWLGNSVVDGVRWALDHPQEVRARIKLGQTMIERDLDPVRLATQWETVILNHAAWQISSAANPAFAEALPGSIASTRS